MNTDSDPAAVLADARAALRRGDALGAVRRLQPLLDGGAPLDDPRLACTAAIDLGQALALTGDPAAAMRRLAPAEREALRLGEPALAARAALALAVVDHAVGDAAAAARRLEEVAGTADALGDDAVAAEVWHQLGITLARLDRDLEAGQCLARAAALRADADPALLGMTRNSLGVLALHRGNRAPDGSDAARRDHAEARAHFETAEALARAGGDRHLEALAQGNLGTVAGASGDLEEARARFEDQIAVLRAMGDRVTLSLALVNLGEAHRRAGRLEAALAASGEGLAVGESLGSLPRQRRAHLELSATCEALGDFAAALRHHKEFHALDRRIRTEEAERQASQAVARLAVDEARREAEAYRSERDTLRGANARLAEEARTDALTGLGNRRGFDDWAAAERAQGALAVLDLDHFKQINDAHGHATGDRVLAEVGRLLLGALRPGDRAFRLGGEELAVWLPGLGVEAARGVCERLRRAVAEFGWGAVAPGLRVTTSVGVAAAAVAESPLALSARADAALYAAKAAGRDRVVVAPGAAPADPARGGAR